MKITLLPIIPMLRTGSIILCLLIAIIFKTTAQIPQGTKGDTDNFIRATQQNDTIPKTTFSLPDTAQVRYFSSSHPERIYLFTDTSLDNHFQQYLPLRMRNDELVSLGYPGSAARPLNRPVSNRMGFDLGFHQFDAYFFNNQDFRFYVGDKSFSQGKWTFRSMGNDSNLDFEYGGHYKKDIYFTLNWKRINSSTTGDYKLINQSAINSNWGAALAQIKNKYSWYLSFSSNGFQQNDNGGLISDDALRNKDTLLIGGRQSIPPKISIPVNVTFTSRNIQWKHSWKLNRNVSSNRNLQLVHQANVIFTKYKSAGKFGNRTVAQQINDSLYFGDLLSDSRGVRLFLKTQEFDNRISLSGTAQRQNSIGNRFDAGIRHRFIQIFDDIQYQNVQNLFAFAEIDFKSFSRFQLNTYFHLGMLPANAGEYKMEGNIFLDLEPLGTLEGRLTQQRYQPAFLQNRLLNVEKEVWTNNFQKTFETTFSAAWTLKKIGFKAEGSYQLLNNYIYYSENLRPRQVTSGLSIFQIMLTESLRFWHIGLDNYVSFQKSTDDRVHVPLISGKHCAFIEGNLFRKKAMLARAGLELRYITSYQADAYQALTGQFYWQNSISTPFFPSADVFISAKVKRTRVFVKLENFTRSWDKRTVFYQTPNYPIYDTYFRIGIQRIFTD
ncbi:MAG: putative porin [Saprospiraceae bacterium]